MATILTTHLFLNMYGTFVKEKQNQLLVSFWIWGQLHVHVDVKLQCSISQNL